MEGGHVPNLVVIVEDDVGDLFRQFLIIPDEPGIAVGARNDGGLSHGEGALIHHESATVHQADGLQKLLTRVGFQCPGQRLLGIGHCNVRPNACRRAGGDAFQFGIADAGGLPAGDEHAPEPGGQQEHNPQKQGRRSGAPRVLFRAGVGFPVRHRHQTAEGGPCQVHKCRGKAQQRGAQNEKVGHNPRQKAQPEQRLPRRAPAATEGPGPRQHHNGKKLADVHGGIPQHTKDAFRHGTDTPQPQQAACPVPAAAVAQPPDQNQHGGQRQRLCQEFCHIQRLGGKAGHPLSGGKAILGIVEDEADPLQEHSNPHAGQHPGQKGRRAARAAQHKQHGAPGQAQKFRFAPAAAQNHHAQEERRSGHNALGKGQEAQTGAHRPRHHEPGSAEAAGVIMVKAQKGRHRKVELLAHIIRAKEPLGRIEKQHQRGQKRRPPAKAATELPVKHRAHGRLAEQNHRPRKENHPGGAPRDRHKKGNQHGGGQGGELMRLPHGLKQPVPLHQPVADGEGILLIDFQPHKEGFRHGQPGQNQQNGGGQTVQPVLRCFLRHGIVSFLLERFVQQGVPRPPQIGQPVQAECLPLALDKILGG